MKKTIILFLSALVFTVSAYSQPSKDVRMTETKIADLLMRLPAGNSADLDIIMAELAGMGEPAVTCIAANLVPPGRGNDVASRYALSGLVKYVSKGTDLKLRNSCSAALCKALGNAKDEEVKDFLLQELQYAAGEEAVSAAKDYLLNKRLCDPATRVLIRINSEASKNAMTEALPKADLSQQIIITEALGRVRYVPAVQKLRDLTATSDPKLKKTILRSLAEIGDIRSASLLSDEAERAGYSFNPTDAAGSYLLFLKRTAENGNSSFTEKACKKILGNSSIPDYARTAALQILATSAGQKAVPVLMKALQSSDKEYRMAAEALLGKMSSVGVFAQIAKTAEKTKNMDLQAELISLMADNNVKSSLPLMMKSLQSSDKQVRLAAISAIAKTGQAEAVAPLTSLMKSGDPEIIDAARTALLTIAGEGVADAAASVISEVTGPARCALIDIIAQRNDDRHVSLIFNETGNADSQVRLSAINALPSLVKTGNEKQIAELLNRNASPDEILALQEALFVAVKGLKSIPEQTASVVELMNSQKEKQSLYYNVLAKIGGTEALNMVEKAFGDSNPKNKESALTALIHWSDDSALKALYRICKSNLSAGQQETALNSYIAGISKSEYPVDQKVLMFRNAMELAGTKEQKQLILKEISRNSSLPALVFVSQYLEDIPLQQNAVQAVNAMVLADTGLYGPVVDNIVQKAIRLNKDAEAEYQKQALLKHLASLPKNGGFVAMFNGKDLTGWKGLVGNPISRAKMKEKEMAEAQVKADKEAAESWIVENDILLFTGKGNNLCSVKDYGDFEMWVDWKLFPGNEPDAGIYLRGTPQVQIWDTSRVNVGAQVGSGGLYNDEKNLSKPLAVADNALGEWNTFHIKMIGEKVTVYLNGQLVVDNVTLENYWDRARPIFSLGSIELQAHGSIVGYRDIYLKEIPRSEP